MGLERKELVLFPIPTCQAASGPTALVVLSTDGFSVPAISRSGDMQGWGCTELEAPVRFTADTQRQAVVGDRGDRSTGG